MDVWKELHRFSEERGLDTFETSLLGEVPWSLKDGVGVSHIPAWLAKYAEKNGFEIVAADWKRDCYTLRLLRPNAELRGGIEVADYCQDEQPVCLVCGGEGWVDGRDHLAWDGDGYDDIIECTSCHGSGLAKDMTWC